MKNVIIVLVSLYAERHILKCENLAKTTMFARCTSAKFNGTLLKVFDSKVISELDCVRYCLEEDQCLSLNIKHDNNPGMNTKKIGASYPPRFSGVLGT